MGHEFYKLNHWLWEHPGHNGRKLGFGWFSWKALCIMDAMERFCLQDGDCLLYLDADTFPIADFSVLYDQCAKDWRAMLF